MRAYVRGEAPLAAWEALGKNDRAALLSFFIAGDRSKQLYFHNVRIVLPLKLCLPLLPTPSALQPLLVYMQAQVDSLAPYAQYEVRCPVRTPPPMGICMPDLFQL